MSDDPPFVHRGARGWTRFAVTLLVLLAPAALAAPAPGSLRVARVGTTIRLTWAAGTAPYAIYRAPDATNVLSPAWLVAGTMQLFYEEPVDATGALACYLVDDPRPCTSAADCDDGVACDGVETCDSRTRRCLPGRPVACDDGDTCTTDACREPTGECVYAPRACDDGLACTLDACRQDTGCYARVDPAGGRGTPADLAGRPLGAFPYFAFVEVFNRGTTVRVAVDPFAHPALVGRTCDVYIVADRSAAEWCADDRLADVRGAPDTLVVAGDGVRQNTIELAGSGSLPADAATGIGVGYDVVLDCDRDGRLGGDDLGDGLEDAAGFYVVPDITAAGPLAVTQFDDIGPEPPHCEGNGSDDMRIYYPSVLDDASYTGRFPLVVISHGNGHCYDWYDFLGRHLASYGHIVMAHDNDTGPGIETASTTTLQFTDRILQKQGTLHGGVLQGHIDAHRIAWIGHSRGGEGVVRAYDRLVDEGYVPQRYTAKDIVVISSIAPTDFLGPAKSDPHGVPYHLLYGSADGDVCGCPDNPVAQSFGVYERAAGVRQSTYVHGADHNDFNCCGFEDFSGPADTQLGRPEAQQVQKAVQLALIEHFVDGSRAAEDFLTRSWEEFRPLGVDPADVVVNERREARGARAFVIDDYQSAPSTSESSSGGAVDATVAALAEGRQTETDGQFEWTGLEPFNGMTRGRDVDGGRCAVFEFAAGGDAFYEFAVVPGQRDFSRASALSFRAAQTTRHPLTVAELGDVTFTVTLVDGRGGSSSIDIGAYGGGIEEPYPREGYGAGAGWQNEFQTIRIPVRDFLRDGVPVDPTDIRTVRFEFGASFGSAQGRLAVDDIELVKE